VWLGVVIWFCHFTAVSNVDLSIQVFEYLLKVLIIDRLNAEDLQ